MTYTYTRRSFDPGYEESVRRVTNPNGRGNAAYDQDAERAMLPQDRLLEAEVTLGRTTGIACEFRWASGRKDAWIVVDLPEECVDADTVARRNEHIEQLRERNSREQERHEA